MVVIAIIAFATLGVSLALPDPARSDLDKEATRLASLLDTARAYSRATGLPVVWQITETGFKFDGLPASGIALLEKESHWLSPKVSSSTLKVLLGPEPIIAAQEVRLSLGDAQTRIATDGLQPFSIQPLPAPDLAGASP